MAEPSTTTLPPPAPNLVEELPPRANGADYQARAIKLLEQLHKEPEEGEVQGEAKTEKVSETKVETPLEVSKPPEPELKGFDTLVREKAALRRREEALKAREAQLDPISKALATDDPLAYLQASGKFTYEQLARQLIEGKKPEASAPKALDPVHEEVKELRKMLVDERANAQRAQAYATVVETVRAAPDKFKFVAGKKMEQQVLKNLEDYVNETGGLPAEDLATSIQMSAEALELNLRKEALEWAALLTPGKSVGTVLPSTEAAVQRPQETPATKSAPLTLTNAQAAVPAKPAKPKTAEDYRAMALALLNQADSQ